MSDSAKIDSCLISRAWQRGPEQRNLHQIGPNIAYSIISIDDDGKSILAANGPSVGPISSSHV